MTLNERFAVKVCRYLSVALLFAVSVFDVSCAGQKADRQQENTGVESAYTALWDSLSAIAENACGEVGIAIIVDGRDTLTVNDVDVYPLMSVFKLHQAVALCHELESRGVLIDTVLNINSSELNPDTWSPMLKDYTKARFNLSARRLMEYALQQSDNNASNLMFRHFASVTLTDSFISTLLPRDGFRIAVSEAEMQQDHSLSYVNHSSPLSVAILFERLFNDSILSAANQTFVCTALRTCKTGTDRISAPLVHEEGVTIAHKTGSGYTNERGELIAHNDAAYIILPDGRHYTIVVFIKDFLGNEQEASELISEISAMAYRCIAG